MSDLDYRFQAIWDRACNARSLGALTPELIQLWATERGFDVTSVKEREVGNFERTPAIVLTVGDVKACLPKIQPTGDLNWEERRQAAEAKAAFWEKMGWFSHLCIPRDKSGRSLADARLTAGQSQSWNSICSKTAEISSHQIPTMPVRPASWAAHSKLCMGI